MVNGCYQYTKWCAADFLMMGLGRERPFPAIVLKIVGFDHNKQCYFSTE